MNRKQIMGLIAAALVFTFVSVSSMYARDQIAATVVDMISNVEKPAYNESEPYVGVLDVEGVIIKDTSSTSFLSSPEYNHERVLDSIEEMTLSEANRGILLRVDSPGGSVYESDELYLKLKRYGEQTGRPVYVYMKSQATSGGYYIAMASDGKVFANRNTWTGSVGVIISLLNVKELYDKLGIKEIDIKSGENKSIGASGLVLTDEQRAILQSLVDEAYDQFVDIVTQGRKMSGDKVREVADGRIYTARQALDLGLIDGIMAYEELEELIQTELGFDVPIIEPQTGLSIWQQFARGIGQGLTGFRWKSDAQAIIEFVENKGNGALMYYADLLQR